MATHLDVTNNTLDTLCEICAKYRLSISLVSEYNNPSCYNDPFYGSVAIDGGGYH
jgi:hypothetical protein